MKRLGQRPIDADVRDLRVLLGAAGLAQPFGWVPFACHDSLPVNISTSPSNIYSATIYRALALKTWHQAAHVATPNDGANYWTIALCKAGPTTITSVTTAAIGVATWAILSDAVVAASVDRGDISLLIRVTATGSPGNLSLTGPALFVV